MNIISSLKAAHEWSMQHNPIIISCGDRWAARNKVHPFFVLELQRLRAQPAAGRSLKFIIAYN